MKLPEKAIDRLFERLAATYGNQWLAMWRGIPIEDIKAAWANELAGFAGRLDALAYALEHLPERPPNAIEFRNLARLAPPPEAPALPRPAPNPERVRQAMDAWREAQSAVLSDPQDRLAWAHRIVARAEAGERVGVAALGMAHQAIQSSRRFDA